MLGSYTKIIPPTIYVGWISWMCQSFYFMFFYCLKICYFFIVYCGNMPWFLAFFSLGPWCHGMFSWCSFCYRGKVAQHQIWAIFTRSASSLFLENNERSCFNLPPTTFSFKPQHKNHFVCFYSGFPVKNIWWRVHSSFRFLNKAASSHNWRHAYTTNRPLVQKAVFCNNLDRM